LAVTNLPVLADLNDPLPDADLLPRDDVLSMVHLLSVFVNQTLRIRGSN
jgi:hypothetical protein